MGVKVCGWKAANHGKRVHARIHATAVRMTPSHPHHGNGFERLIGGSTVRGDLKACKINGAMQAKIRIT